MMTLQKLKEEILARETELLTPDRSNKGFICPLCNSGSGQKGTGLTRKQDATGTHYTCWNCGQIRNADIFDIIGLEYGIPSNDFNGKLRKAAEFRTQNMKFGIVFGAKWGKRSEFQAKPYI